MPYSLLISFAVLPCSLSSNICRLNSFVYRFCFKTIFPVLLYNLLYFYPYLLSQILYQIHSTQFEQYLKIRGIVHSTSRKGCPYDNAWIESFHASWKKEEVYTKQYRNYEEAQLHLFEYIEDWYNRRKLHSSLGYQTPDEVYQNG